MTWSPTRDPGIRLADVARKLGVTRQTVYHYIPNARALLMASTMRAVDGFIDQVADHVSGQQEAAVISLTSDTASAFCLSVLHRMSVDWTLHGFGTAALTQLAEMVLRVVQSLLTDPGPGPRAGDSLRNFVVQWLGPAILHQRNAALRRLFDGH